MDIDTIDLGVDFVDALMQTVASCDVLIAVIGKQWLNARDEEGRRRLDNPEDFVRVEISAALERGVRVIPVLVGGSRMPQSADLPDQLAKLARRNALDIPDMHFGEVVGRLITSLERIITEARQQRSVEQERVRAEAERQRFVEVQRTEAERQRLAEPGKAQAGADEQRVAEGEKVRTETERQPAAGSIGMQERPLLDSATVPASDEERRIAAIVAILFEYQTRGFYVTPGIPLPCWLRHAVAAPCQNRNQSSAFWIVPVSEQLHKRLRLALAGSTTQPERNVVRSNTSSCRRMKKPSRSPAERFRSAWMGHPGYVSACEAHQRALGVCGNCWYGSVGAFATPQWPKLQRLGFDDHMLKLRPRSRSRWHA